MGKEENSKFLQIIKQEIRMAGGTVISSDLAASTGLALDAIKDSLYKLMEIYESRISMNNRNGTIVYNFNLPFIKRGAKTAKEIIVDLAGYPLKTVQVFFKILYGIIMSVYLAFFSVLIYIYFDRYLKNEDDKRLKSMFKGFLGGLSESLYWTDWPDQSEIDRYDRATNKDVKIRNYGRYFVVRVFNFVFGPSKPKPDKLGDTREITAYLRRNYRLTAGKIVELSGVPFEKAESLLASYVSKFNGELYIDMNGYIVAEFPEMSQKAAEGISLSRIIPYHLEEEPDYSLTGNSFKHNILLILFNLLNLTMSSLFYFGLQKNHPVPAFVFGGFPFIVSLLFFIIPVFRIPFIDFYEKKITRRRIRKMIFEKILFGLPDPIKKNRIMKRLDLKTGELKLANKIFETLVNDLEAEITLDKNGEIVYEFTRFACELAAVKRKGSSR